MLAIETLLSSTVPTLRLIEEDGDWSLQVLAQFRFWK
jgi:hypothetical protein